jgi:serine/threonine-protein kinase
MAEVFLAHDCILGRDLALKVLREDYAKDAGFVSRFRREAVSAAALNHPHVVQVYDQGRSEDGRLYMTMEHVPGGNLKDLTTRRGPLDPAEAARLASEVAEALGAAHERGIVHRDVKPQNVLIDEAGEAKLADFGIALAASTSTASGTNRVFGTASYMSPEQAMGERVGPQSDLYSLGVVLYEMLTGTLPFEADGALATAMKHVTEQPVPPRERDPSIPEEVDALVMGLLAKDPEARCGSAFELAEDLRRARAGLPLALEGAARHPQTPREFVSTEGGARPYSSQSSESALRRRRPVAMGLVALAALMALLGAFGWDLAGSREGSKAVSTVTTTKGGREGGAPVAPEGSREGGSGGKGVSSSMPSVDLAGGVYVPASSESASESASASASASASPAPATASAPASASPEPPTSETVGSGLRASSPRASGTRGAAPSASSPEPGVPSGSGGQDAGTTSAGAVESAAQGQYR